MQLEDLLGVLGNADGGDLLSLLFGMGDKGVNRGDGSKWQEQMMRFLQSLGLGGLGTRPRVGGIGLTRQSSQQPGGALGGRMRIGPYQPPASGSITGDSQNPAWWYLPGSQRYRTLDPNSAEPPWKQLGFYSKDLWEQQGRPTETGLSRPSLTDPATGIYHYEKWTPEWSAAFLKANESNYRWRPTTEPPPYSFIDPAKFWGPNATETGDPKRGAARPIPPWMQGGSGSLEQPLWLQLGFGSKDAWRAGGKPGQ